MKKINRVKMRIKQISDDSLRLIFLFLDTKTIGLIARTCRNFYRMSNDCIIWNEKLKNNNMKPFKQILAMNESSPFYTELLRMKTEAAAIEKFFKTKLYRSIQDLIDITISCGCFGFMFCYPPPIVKKSWFGNSSYKTRKYFNCLKEDCEMYRILYKNSEKVYSRDKKICVSLKEILKDLQNLEKMEVDFVLKKFKKHVGLINFVEHTKNTLFISIYWGNVLKDI